MREILFRGKRRDNGEWVEGLYNVGYFPFDNQNIAYIKQYGENNGKRIPSGEYEVIPETVGQYTGLSDKNGKKIFEGDIVVCKQEIVGNFIDEVIEIGYVEIKYGAFGLHRKQGYYRPFKDWLENYEYEVIGNIHDNPELLGGIDNGIK